MPQLKDRDIELIISDNCSTDSTNGIAQEFAAVSSQIKVFRNAENLGMDGNFEKIVTYASGEHIWYCGHDDIFGEGAVEKVLNVLENNPELDFIYMNFSRHSHEMSELILERHVEINQDILCKDYNHFLEITTLGQLPSFLPSFIMSKSCFDKAEKAPFYGTYFVQLGAFFSVLKDMNLYIIAEPLVKGRIPDNRWQQDSEKLLDILSGDFEVIKYAYKNYGVINNELYASHYKKVRKWLLNSIIKVKSEGKSVSEKLLRRFKFIFSPKDYFFTKIILLVPKSFFDNKFTFKLIKLLR